MPKSGRILLPRRLFVAGGFASLAFITRARATPPASIADGTTIGRQKMLIVLADASGRIVAFDSSTYMAQNPTDQNDVVAIGSYCGTRVLQPIFARGVRAVIATDAGIGKDEAGISGMKSGQKIGVPVAAIAAMSAETSNGRATLLGTISRVNTLAQSFGVKPGMVAYEAAMLLMKAPPGKPTTIPRGAEEKPIVVETTAKGRIWATPGTTAIREKIPNDVICSGANSSRVMSDGVFRMGAKGAIANDAGIAKNNTAVEGVKLLGEKGIPAASVSTMTARLGEGLSTWNDGVISVVNAIAAARGVKVGMTAKTAAKLMLG
jgi:hypothetical protein